MPASASDLRITAEAGALQRAGRPMIVLGAGEPDFDTPDNVKDAAIRAIRAGATKYTILDGSPALKEAVRRGMSVRGMFAQIKVWLLGISPIVWRRVVATRRRFGEAWRAHPVAAA